MRGSMVFLSATDLRLPGCNDPAGSFELRFRSSSEQLGCRRVSIDVHFVPRLYEEPALNIMDSRFLSSNSTEEPPSVELGEEDQAVVRRFVSA